MLVSYSIGLKFFYISGLNKMHADTHLKKWSIHMNIEFSKRADRFGSNIFNILNQKKNDRLAQGKPVYNFTVGTPDFKPDESVMKVVSEAALDPENYKYSLGDTDELLDAVCKWYKRRYNTVITPDEVASVFGTQEGMAHIALALCNPGDLCLVPNPGYPIFEIGPFLCDAQIAYYNLLPENDYLIDFVFLGFESDIDINKISFQREYKKLTKYIDDRTKETFLKYLRGWYRSHLHSSWYDSHKNEKFKLYFGYWCFEAGAIAKRLGFIDDDLKNEQYYPYDMVHFN